MTKRALAPSGGNDVVYTPSWLAQVIVDHYQPTGKFSNRVKVADRLPISWLIVIGVRSQRVKIS